MDVKFLSACFTGILQKEWDPPKYVLAEVPHSAAGEGGVSVDVLIIIEPLRKFDLET